MTQTDRCRLPGALISASYTKRTDGEALGEGLWKGPDCWRSYSLLSKAAEIPKKEYPDMCIEIEMAGEFILGTYGDLLYYGVSLAGLYPHEQVNLAEKGGGTISRNSSGLKSTVSAALGKEPGMLSPE